MQKLVYLSNCRDFTEQENINENKYFTYANSLLDQGWTVTHISHHAVNADATEQPYRKETLMAFVLLEKEETGKEKENEK